jgi:lipoate-protein ligase A
VRVVEVDEPAFVIGSTQPEPEAATSQRVVRRRSGGGGVLVVPGDLLWVDIIVPRTDPWWEDDVGRAAHPIGQAWATALDLLGLEGVVHRGAMVATAWSRSLCFAGLGPGEVSVDGHKVVGIAQRRTRQGACFQCAVPLTRPGRTSVEAAGLSGVEAREATAGLTRDAGAVGRRPSDLLDALAHALDRPR